MRVLITGICGFVGSSLATALREHSDSIEVAGVDNFIRPGSEQNRLSLKRSGISVLHADLRVASDVANLSRADWVIDAAANPSVMAGLSGSESSRQIVEHNLGGTINLLEYCRSHGAGFILLSTSRVYSIKALSALPLTVANGAYELKTDAALPSAVSREGVSEEFSTEPPLSLYGTTKRASELLALEYGETFGIPTWINRCGVMAGAGQFGRADQGIFSFWIHSWLRGKPLKYIGFDGQGFQVRDCLHPRDLCAILLWQMAGKEQSLRTFNLSGGIQNSMSLAQLSAWCESRFGARKISSESNTRTFDVPWLILDSARAEQFWNWKPTISINEVLSEIAEHAEQNPDWMEISSV